MVPDFFDPPLPQRAAERYYWNSLYGSSAALALISAAKKATGPLLVVTPDRSAVHGLMDALFFFKDEALKIAEFPDWETLPYDTFSPHEDIISARLSLLAKLTDWHQGIILLPVSTLMSPLMPRDYLFANSLILEQGEQFNIDQQRQRLVQVGYRIVEQVMQHGEFAVRGSVVDIFPMGSELPYRIDLLDDEIDSIRTFNIDTQRSLEKVNHITLLPAKEFPLDEAAIVRFRQSWREKFTGNTAYATIYQAVTQGIAPPGIEYYLPLFYDKTATFFDYLAPTATIIFFEKTYQSAQDFWLEITGRYQQYGHDITRPLLEPQQLFLAVEQLFSYFKQYPQIEIAMTPHETGFNFPSLSIEEITINVQAQKPLQALTDFILTTPQRVLLTAETEGRREIILDLLAAADIRPAIVKGWSDFLMGADSIGLTVASLDHGVSLLSPSVRLITEAELYGERVMQRRLRKRKSFDENAMIRNLFELHIGTPVVHLDHGVGRYLGLETLTTNNITTEFAVIEYAENTKLYVPIANLNVLNRYTGGDIEHAPLHRLGTEQWTKAKQRAAERAKDVAAELLDLYARRAAKPGVQFDAPDENYQAFVAGFPFEETPDQLKAIEEVLHDLQKPIPMDRLVCGDVGFGKTEVAIRATFLAVQNHKQVALLVPTTLLAEQHYQNFKNRFANWPVTIELLSRFRSSKQQTDTLSKLVAGHVDIVIGTHKLLQGGVQFANLGLLIIDEEHRFGVKQKEAIKALRTDVNILTLTATPIPRTLNMSLAGLRELSLITTPPAKRLSIKTFVQERGNAVIREAILREILRGGQVFFLHNSVETIERTASEINQIVPEAQLSVAHGQMPERQLEKIMSDFYHQRFNVLVCTTIVETGIDIPTANTIIIDRADKLGLAQLHQLRGRVGRSHHQAYAYLLTPDKNSLTKEAEHRLAAIMQAEELGSGFILASQDLEIRGAGELLGEGQSGQIEAVGFSLYNEYLEHAVQSLKSGKQPDFTKPLLSMTEIDLHLSAMIPEKYIPDVHQRLMLYKRIANATNESMLKDLQVEMIDRFGLLPDETKHLFQLTSLKLRAQSLGITKIQASGAGGFLEFNERPAIEPIKLLKLIQQYPSIYKLQGSQRLNFGFKTDSAKTRFDAIEQLLRLLS